MLRSRRAPPYLLAALALACDDVPQTTTGEAATLIVVDPARFLGELPCSDVPGGVRRYVATAVDVTLSGVSGGGGGGDSGGGGDGEEFALPSSPPVRCTETVSFSNVVSGHWYVADVQAYDREDIEPRGPGSFLMVDAETGQHVEPRWATSCGRSSQEDPLLALHQNARTLHRCEPLVDLHPGGATGISVALLDLLGNRECGADAGQVFSYRATLDDTRIEAAEAPCASPLTFTGLEASRNYRLELEAFEQTESEARWVTSCFAKTAPNVMIPATCDPLQDKSDGGSGGTGSGGAAGAAGATP